MSQYFNTSQPFKVGDIIRGENNYYTITNKYMKKAEVVEVSNHSREMRVRILEHTDTDVVGNEYPVYNTSDGFELIKDVIKDVVEKKENNYIDLIKCFMDKIEAKEIIVDGLKIINLQEDK